MKIKIVDREWNLYRDYVECMELIGMRVMSYTRWLERFKREEAKYKD